jgi:hypothetical protein
VLHLGRRSFFQFLSAVSAWAAEQSVPAPQPAPAAPRERNRVKRRKPYIAIQIGPVSFVDEGTEKVLDIVQEKAHVNTIWLNTYSYDRGTAGRQIAGQPLPDHGVQAYDPEYRGGASYDYNPQYFKNTILNEFRSTDYNGLNILNEVLPKAKARGIDVVAWDNNNNFSAPMKNYTRVAEIDVYGRRSNAACFNNEDYRGHLFGKVEDYLRSYPELSGIAWCAERMGPLMNLIGGGWSIPFITCFCPACRAKGRERDISVERARRGYLEMAKLFEAAHAGARPNDGFFVTFWRTLLEYPEILAWEKLWTDGYHDVRAEIYSIAKQIEPTKPMGWHIMHNATLSPFYRAEENYAETRRYADFVKAVVYNNCGGPRMVAFLDRLTNTVFHDVRPEELTAVYYKLMNYEEGPHSKLATAGLSADYVRRETRRAVAGVNAEIPVYAGIDVDIPTGPNQKKTTVNDVRDSVKAAFAGGAEGVVLSRKYSEMTLSCLAGAGQGVREAGVLG